MKLKSTLWVSSLVFLSANMARADVKMPSLFSDDMVLQRGKNVPIWGKADVGERIAVRFARQIKTTVADANGRWMVRLSPLKVATKMTLQINGKNAIAFKNVAVGDVYICAGQSNMEYPLEGWSAESAVVADAQKEIAAANYPKIRLFAVPRSVKAAPADDTIAPTSWQVCTPQNARTFSAVGYFFGRDIHRVLDVPIGLIDASWGGTYIEAWTSRETLGANPKYQAQIAALQEASRSALPLNERMAAWWKSDVGSQASWQSETLDDASWKNVKLPQLKGWEKDGLPDFDGVVWFRKTVDVPSDWKGDLTLHLGAIDDRDTTFWNGTEIGASDFYNTLRNYTIPAKLVRPGRNIIAVRVLDTGGVGGFWGNDALRLEAGKDASIPLDNVWKMRVSTELKSLPPVPAVMENNPNQPTVLYNGMIAPLVPFALRGAIWYQGEANTGQPTEYRALFPNMIRDWRAKFGQDFGFYWVQLANFQARELMPGESNWAELREAQSMTLSLPHTGMATTIDIGSATDIHPTNKKEVGHRLALSALAKEYGKKIESSGPMFGGLRAEIGAVRVLLTHAKGLRTNDGQLPRGFAIAGDDRVFQWAQAKIDGTSIVLSNAQIVVPKFVRYGWANNPDVNVYNGVGLPAVPFRSDVDDTADDKR